MALDFTAYLCDESCDSLKIIDTTGSYDPATNVGGYETPNVALADITGATVTITLSNGTVYGPIQVFNPGTLLPSNPGVSFTLDKATLGGSLVDGLAKAEFVLTGNDILIEKTLYFFVTCTAKCCVQKLALNIDPNDKCCDGSAAEVFNKAYKMLMQVRWLANECCNFTKAQAVLERLAPSAIKKTQDFLNKD